MYSVDNAQTALQSEITNIMGMCHGMEMKSSLHAHMLSMELQADNTCMISEIRFSMITMWHARKFNPGPQVRKRDIKDKIMSEKMHSAKTNSISPYNHLEHLRLYKKINLQSMKVRLHNYIEIISIQILWM